MTTAGIRFDIFCDRHVICYCAMIDYVDTMAAPTAAQDASSKACIVPPPSAMPDAAKGLALLTATKLTLHILSAMRRDLGAHQGRARGRQGQGEAAGQLSAHRRG